jgi:hypothetical protein
MSVVESTVDEQEQTTPETPSEWFDHNVRATFHSIIENMTLRSESEKVVLHALVDDLDKDPADVIAKLEIAPINQGGGGYVDPVLAQVLSDNAALRNDVKELLDALRSNAASSQVTAAENKVDEDLAIPEPTPTQVTSPAPTPTPIQTAPAPTPVDSPSATQEEPAAQNTPGVTSEISPTPEAPATAPEPAPETTSETTNDLPPAI